MKNAYIRYTPEPGENIYTSAKRIIRLLKKGLPVKFTFNDIEITVNNHTKKYTEIVEEYNNKVLKRRMRNPALDA